MAENHSTATGPEGLMWRFLRLDERLDGFDRKFDEVIARLTRLERETSATRRDIANLHEDWVGLSHRLDNFDQRLGRIERRLDLVEDAPATPAAEG